MTVIIVLYPHPPHRTPCVFLVSGGLDAPMVSGMSVCDGLWQSPEPLVE